ncbi:hypothetical protein G9A89_019338 [Geosiphon pyriformis]|nr:hypothetical protein G9A89_019338 [Geosiphon pyriformis]
MDKTTIESLFIIQKTPSKPSDTILAKPHQWKTSTNPNLNVTESENIRANHLGFAKFLFQQYSQQLGLNSNHYPAESAFNFYINDRITECLGETVNIEAAKENFYTELFQHINLPRNYSFVPIIREINQTIKRYTQQQFSITYTDKSKGKIQTPAATLKGIQLPSWKKHRVESPTTLSYHYTLESTINISLADTKQQKEDLLGPYRAYFEEFKSQSPTSSRIRSPPPQPDFGIATLWELSEKEEEEELEDQEFTYQNPITENPEVETPNFQAQQSLNLENLEIKIPNHQRQNNPNSELSNQQNLPPVIVIDQLPINPVAEPIQQPFQLPLQQPVQQQPLQQPPQQPNLDPIAYASIAKLDNFTGKEDDVQVWLNDIEKAITANRWNDAQALQAISYFLKDTTDAWYQSLAVKPQNFNDFKMEFVRYFSNNNSINKLANFFTTIKQGDTEAVTTYLGCFHRNLHQIQAIQADYFTVSQILNQFIRGLHSNLLQQVCLMHPVNLPTAVTHARDFEAAELEANHTQAVNLVMNRSSELNSKLKQFIYHGSWKHVPATTVVNKTIFELIAILIATNNWKINTEILIATMMTSENPRPRIAQNWRLAMVVHQLVPSSSHQSLGPHSRNLGTGTTQNPTSQHYLSLLVTSEDTSTNNQEFTQKQQTLTSNILPATVTNDESLTTIFLFEIKEPSSTPLFSGATLNEKPITTMYTDAKVDDCQVDRAASARIITADGVIKTPIGEIDNFLFKVNSIVTPIKVLVMEATQYQALVEKQGKEPTCETTIDTRTNDKDHYELPPVLLWDDNPKGKQREKLTWETNNLTWTNNEQKKASSWKWNEDKRKGKEKKERTPPTIDSYNSYTYHTPQQSNY